MAEYTYKQWGDEQSDENVIHADDCYRWQAGVEAAGGTWDGEWIDDDRTGKGLITIQQFNDLEQEIANLYGSGFTPKKYDPDSTVQIVPGPAEWNRIEDAINTILNRTAFAIYCETDNSLTFYVDTEVPEVGDTYEGKAVTAVYTGLEDTNFSGADAQPWASVRDDIQSVVINSSFNMCKPKSLQRWFMNFGGASFTGLNYIDTSEVTSLLSTFNSCTALTSIDALANWDVSKVTTLASTFRECTSITSIDALANWDVSSVTNISYAFRATAITTLDPLAKWDISSVTDMTAAFYECTKLQTANLPGLNAASLTTFVSTFYGCTSLTEADLSWSAAAVTTLQNLFYNSTSLVTVNLAGIDTANVTNTSSTFRNCSKLTTVYVSEGQFNTDKVTSDTNMFASCTSIVGGNGTTFDSSKIDSSMAHIDTEDNPGYFTAKG